MSRDIADKVDQQIKYYTWWKYMVAMLLILLMIMVAIVQFLTLANVLKTTDQIKSCIDPKGQCYRTGDRRSSAVVKTINDNQKQIVTITVFCAKQPGNETLEQIQSCVDKELGLK